MAGYIVDIEAKTLQNKFFREVLYTTHNMQLVVMKLDPKEEIGEEIHELDQFIRVELGVGKAILDEVEYEITDGSAIIIPKGTKHNIINTSDTEPLALYTIYTPPEHKDKTIHETKHIAQLHEEHFDGKISAS